MPFYTVTVTRKRVLEETCTTEIEAKSARQAVQRARQEAEDWTNDDFHTESDETDPRRWKFHAQEFEPPPALPAWLET